jgi:hypothetical protein
LSGTDAVTKLLVLLGPSSPRLIETARGLLATPSVVTPPPELPVRVTEPPELISTNFETVALMVTVPDVDCPGHVRAETISNIVKNIKLIVFERGMICMSFEEELDVVIRPSANKLTTGAT